MLSTDVNWVVKKTFKIVLIILVTKRLKEKKHIRRRLDTNLILSGFEYVNIIIWENLAHSIKMLCIERECFWIYILTFEIETGCKIFIVFMLKKK